MLNYSQDKYYIDKILELNGVVNTIKDTKAIQLQQLLSLLDLQEKPKFTVEYKTEPLKKLFLTTIGEENWQQLEELVTKSIPEIKNKSKKERREYIIILIRKGYLKCEFLGEKK